MNTKGIKFLAVLAVLAMAFAAFAVISDVDDNDAAEQTIAADITVTTDSKAFEVATEDNKKVEIGGTAATVTLSADDVLTIAELYVPADRTVVIQEGITIGKLFAVYDADKYADNIYLGALATDGGQSITIYVGSSDEDGSIAVIKGTAKNAFTVTGDFEVGIAANQTFVYNLASYAAPAILSDYAYKYDSAALTMTFFGTQQTSVSILNGDYFKPISEGISITNSETGTGATVQILALGANEFVPGVVFSVNAVSGVLEATGEITSGEVKVTDGSMILKTAFDASGDAAVTGAIAADLTADTIVADTEVFATLAEGHLTVIGNFTVSDNNLKVGNSVIVGKNALLTIPAKKTMTVGRTSYEDEMSGDTITVNEGAALDVWGTLTGVNGKNTDKNTLYPALSIDGDFFIRNGAKVTGFVDTNGETSIDIDTNGTMEELPAKYEYTEMKLVISDDTTMSEVVLNDTSKIDEGKTLTITGFLALSGQTLNVNGTLIIAEGAVVGDDGTGEIILGDKGEIINNGQIGKYVPVSIEYDIFGAKLLGVTGVDLSFGTYQEEQVLVLSGDIEPMANSNVSCVMYTGLIDNTNIGSKVSFLTMMSLVDAGKTLTVDGAIYGNVLLDVDATIDINGYAGPAFVVEAQTTGIEGVLKDVTDLDITDLTFTPVLDGVNPIGYATGVNITVIKTPFKNADGKDSYYQRLYIEGDLKSNTTIKAADVDTLGTITVDGLLFVAEGKELKQNGFIKLAMADPTEDYVVVEGKITSLKTSDGETGIEGVVGATYTVEVTGDSPSTTYYAENVNVALQNLVAKRTVTLNGIIGYDVELVQDLTVSKDVVIDAAGVAFLIIPASKTITVENEGTMNADAIKAIKGKLVVETDGDCVPGAIYDVSSTDDANTTTYCGFQTALDEATAGSTISIAKTILDAGDSLSIPAEITVVVDAGKTLNVKKALTIAADAKLEVNGTLNFGSADAKATKVTVTGTLDISAGSAAAFFQDYTGTDADKNKMTIESNGSFIYKDSQTFFVTDADNAAILKGAIYKDGSKNVLTSIEKAIDADAEEITIDGSYESADAIDIGDAVLNINGTASIAKINLEGGSVIVTGTLTGIVDGLSDESDATEIKLTKFVGTITDAKADDKYTMAITSLAGGSVEITKGTVVLKDASSDLKTKQTFTVASEATLQISDDDIVLTGEADSKFVLDGALVIDKNKEFSIDNNGTNMKITLGGSVDIQKGAILTIDAATISGAVDVAGKLVIDGDVAITGSVIKDSSDESEANLTINGDVTLGTSTLGAAATLEGKIDSLDAGVFIAVYPNAEIDEAATKDLIFTEFYINGSLYVTAYGAVGCTVVNIGGVITDAVSVPGYDMSGMTTAANWKDSTGAAAGANTVGVSDKISFSGVQYYAKILLSTVTHVSVFVDGVRYDSGFTIEDVKVGNHTITVSIDPGYKGTTAVTFNGAAVTNSFNVTADMTGAAPAAVVLSVTGDIQVDGGVTPAPEPSSSSDFGVTEILLIVLVVLCAVLVIVIILKLNRS